MDIKWKAPKPDAKKLSQPEGASSYYLDAYASGDLELARQIWKEYGGAIQRDREIDNRNWTGSWNWWPIGLAASLLASDAGTRPALVTRARHRRALEDALAALRRALKPGLAGREDLLAEELRIAARALGRLTGRVDVEDILDVIFRDFCIGK